MYRNFLSKSNQLNVHLSCADLTTEDLSHDSSSVKPKAVKSQRGAFKTTRRYTAGKKMSIVSALSHVDGPKVNVSRRPPSNILYAFPHFDRCDSLLYFPCTLTRHLNTGDFTAVSKLFSSHIDKDCRVFMDYAAIGDINVKSFLKLHEVMLDLQPDRIMCVHSTKVVENQIFASVYLKATDNKTITDSVARTVKDPVCASLFTMDRAERMKLKTLAVERTEEERLKMIELADSGEDILVYVRLNLALTFNDVTKKITSFVCNGQVTSMHAVKDL